MRQLDSVRLCSPSQTSPSMPRSMRVEPASKPKFGAPPMATAKMVIVRGCSASKSVFSALACSTVSRAASWSWFSAANG